MVGLKTNVIASIVVTDGLVSDYEPFPALLETLCKNMNVKEISADMDYSSRKVLDRLVIIGQSDLFHSRSAQIKG